MSRTDVHRPWPIQMGDPHNRHLLHRHQEWPWKHVLVPHKNIACGCNLCTQQGARRRMRRQERHNARRALRTTITLREGGEPIDDEPVIRRQNIW